MWSQVDAGVALTIGAIVEIAAVRKLQRPRVFALTLQRLDPRLVARRPRSLRLAVAFATFEAIVGIGVVVFRGTVGFVFACALVVACAGFLAALARAVNRSVPCGCFGRLGRTAAGGREIARALVLVVGAGFLVVHRAIDPRAGYGFGAAAALALVITAVAIVAAQRIGAAVRPGVEAVPAEADDDGSVARSLRRVAGFDNDLYTLDS